MTGLLNAAGLDAGRDADCFTGIKVGIGVRSTKGAAWLHVSVKPQAEI